MQDDSENNHHGMLEADKAKTTIPESPAQQFLARVDARDKMARAAGIAILLALVVFNVFTAIRLQNVIDQNQRDTLEARQANTARQNELKDYIKCVLLIRYDVPAEALTTRDGVEAALDACATAKAK